MASVLLQKQGRTCIGTVAAVALRICFPLHHGDEFRTRPGTPCVALPAKAATAAEPLRLRVERPATCRNSSESVSRSTRARRRFFVQVVNRGLLRAAEHHNDSVERSRRRRPSFRLALLHSFSLPGTGFFVNSLGLAGSNGGEISSTGSGATLRAERKIARRTPRVAARHHAGICGAGPECSGLDASALGRVASRGW